MNTRRLGGLLLLLLWPVGCAASSPSSTLHDALDGDGASPAATISDAGSLVTIPLTACDPTVYSASVTIGGSGAFSLILDTASTTLAVAAHGCQACSAAGVATLYDPGPMAVDEDAGASSLFGSSAATESGWTGEVYQDWVGVQVAPELARVKLVAMTQENEFLVGTCGQGPPEGVLGLAPELTAIRGTDGFFDQLVSEGDVPNVFATRLCPTEGTLWLGGYDPAYTSAPPVYTPMVNQAYESTQVQAWYAVNLVSVSAAGTTAPVATATFPGSMLDTGSSWSSFPPGAFSAITQAIASTSAFMDVFGSGAASFFSNPDACVPLTQTKAALDAALPPFTLTFGSDPAVTVEAAPTESYLVNRGGQWCPAVTALAPDANAFPSIAAHVGAPLLASSVVIFDRQNQRVGFAPHTPCPTE